MNRFVTGITVALVSLGWASLASSQMVDGTLSGDEGLYGAALSIQNTDTGFGDSTLGDPQFGGSGSEIDQVFGAVANGRLHVLITGNLEGVQGGAGQFNKLEVFIDSAAGGVNTIVGADLPAAVDAYCCGGPGTTDGALQRMNGLKFDTQFSPDRFLTFTNGFESITDSNGNSSTFWAMSSHYADLTQGASGQVGALGMRLNAFGSEPGLSTGEIIDQNNNDGSLEQMFADPGFRDMSNVVDLQMAINNSNTVGVIGGADPIWDTLGDPFNVITGIEFSIPLSQLGAVTGDIKLAAFVNGNGHHYASNQFAGFGVLGNNLGGDGLGGFTGDLSGVDLSAVTGDQFVTIAYTPSNVDVDFDGDGLVNCNDVDALVAEIVAGTNQAQFDLNGDNVVGIDDLYVWLADGATFNGFSSPYLVGDANLSGSVDVTDFAIVNVNKFGPGAAWCKGDFNADGFVDVSDVGAWNSNKFTSSLVNVVPEPSAVGLWMLAAGSLLMTIRRR